MASGIIQHWNHGAEALLEPPPTERRFSDPPRLGVVIGTFAAVPYIHLQLEARRRLFPGVPILVHDDGSHQAAEIQRLCREYGADFETNTQRQPPSVGDLTAFVGGLWWAMERQLDLLVKVSRRWLFLTNWTESLRDLALQSQYATFSSYTTTFGFGFRTECLGMAVSTWGRRDFLRAALDVIHRGETVFVEAWVHDFARQFERENGSVSQAWRRSHPSPPDRNGYALWTLMGTDRCERSPYFLWHDSCNPDDYWVQSKAWDLPYTRNDFLDPNQGRGTTG